MHKTCGFVGFLALGLCLLAGPVWAQESVDGELERLDELVRTASREVVAYGAAYAREELRDYVAIDEFGEATARLAREVESPLVRFVLDRQAARALAEVGAEEEYGDSDEFARGQGCLVDWALVGPFENAAMQGFYERLGPETGEMGPYEGRWQEEDWRSLEGGHYFCSLALSQRVHPQTSAVAYLATTLQVEEVRPVRLLVGSRGAYRIWVNGEAVGQRVGSEVGLGLDAEGYEIVLESGANEVVVKLGSTGEGGLGFVARLVDEASRPVVMDAREGRRDNAGNLEVFGNAGPEPAFGVRKVIEEGEFSEDANEQLWAAYVLQRLYSEDAATPWRDGAEYLLTSHLERLEGRERVLLSTMFEEHWKRQAILDGAVEVAPGDRYVRWARARELGEGLSHLEWQQQYEELTGLVEEAPAFLRAVESLALWYEQHEGGVRALNVWRQYEAEDRVKRMAWARRVVDLEDRYGEKARAAALREEVVHWQQISGLFGWQLLREEVARGDMAGALERAQAYRERLGWTRAWALQEAMLLRASGDFLGARARLEAMVEANPGDPALYERLAALSVAQGDLDGAMARLEEAIVLRPQSTHLQEYLDHLRPESDRFYEPWVVKELRELAGEVEAGPHDLDHIVEQRVHQVATNGLSRQFVQQATRVLREEGKNGGSYLRVTYQEGDERVEVIGVKVHKPDGTVGEDFQQWRTGNSQKRTTTYNDSVYLNLRARNVEVGDIVEFQYVVHQVANENFRGDYFGNVAYIQRTEPIALFRYAVVYPEAWELYFRTPELPHERWEGTLPDGEVVAGMKVTGFQLQNVPRVYTDEDQPGFADVYDHIIVSNKGSYEEVGRWWWNLVEEQLVVDDAIREQVRALTEGMREEAARVEAIYDFVARNTRYLHVGLGIHGWKPYRTSTILRNRYGDCKDKSALLKVMLEEAGVEAHLALVRTRRLGSIDEEPASMHVFNHAVTYVPSMDLFLDATAEFNGPYELTSMDQGAQALIVRDGGSTRWVTMPVDEPDQNLMRQALEVDLSGEVPVLSGQIVAYGANAVSYRRTLEDPERRDERFEGQLSSTFPGVRLVEARYQNLEDLHAPTIIDFLAEVPGVLREEQGGTSFQTLGSPRDLLGRYARESTRNQDRTFRVPFAQEINVRYRLPANQALERIPESRQVESPFGEMRVSYERVGGELMVDVRYTIGVQRVAVSEYAEFREFVTTMHEALNETIRLIDEGGSQ